ncbi:GntR family transcriptional regulator [Variovorax sp. RHLX14]|uniref:GntR family transcriptional regulator n=1 Tax=Variovorax sp. RHLX14 TaxID=1259731 RepID=UPI003F490481
MKTISQPSAGPDPAGSARQSPLYALVADVIRRSIRADRIPAGAVLLEGPVAQLLGCTRTPVRYALNALADEGLISRFDGRGYAVGATGVVPERIVLTAAMLGAVPEGEPVRKTLGWEAIHEQVERQVVHLSVFGRHRINELELARRFGVGRTVARSVLLRMEGLGLVEKDERLRWTVTPLDDDRINHLYELRWLLEPTALRASMLAGVSAEAVQMATGLRSAIGDYPEVSAGALDALEHDLHVRLLRRCPNLDLLKSLQRTRCVLTLSKHVLGDSAPMPERDPFMAEHLAVLEAVAGADGESASRLLRAHLEAACLKVVQRAGIVRESYAVPELSWIDER